MLSHCIAKEHIRRILILHYANMTHVINAGFALSICSVRLSMTCDGEMPSSFLMHGTPLHACKACSGIKEALPLHQLFMP